ncbi:hypothetical protein H5P28_05860 [Ruficoccus amylovorans]|uniref:Uncharacterized protein n=1 Tax=Ruficoccus amylovorans TaxID=1804625 RepID=A0A842HBI7_9BACT|nr:hypothetical protein [Ruficoccus amylovorans]MBC2593782.1 hypothetical protein [Ruficoccus amylovorans]
MRTPHYQYFLALEQEFEESIRFAELDNRNSSTFSTSYLKMLFAACIEVESVLKAISNRSSISVSPDNINGLRRSILGIYPAFHRITVEIPRYSMSISPWESWGNNTNPPWWHAYTATKHSRQTSYEQANQRNVVDAIAALFASLIYLYAEPSQRIHLDVEPRLFHYENLFPSHLVCSSDITFPTEHDPETPSPDEASES